MLRWCRAEVCEEFYDRSASTRKASVNQVSGSPVSHSQRDSKRASEQGIAYYPID